MTPVDTYMKQRHIPKQWDDFKPKHYKLTPRFVIDTEDEVQEPDEVCPCCEDRNSSKSEAKKVLVLSGDK